MNRILNLLSRSAKHKIFTQKVILWAESEAEVHDFISLIDKEKFVISKIFVAKKSGGKRDVGSKYIEGVYFPYDIKARVTLDSSVVAPKFITDLVQWCSPDIILANKDRVLISIETTYHILTYNNVAQRIPRQVRSASLKIPNVIFQKVDYSFSKGVAWYVKTLLRATKIYNSPCMAILFNDAEFESARKVLVTLVNSCINNQEQYSKVTQSILTKMEKVGEGYKESELIFGQNGLNRTWLRVSDDTVTVIIGVKDNCALTKIPGYGCQGNDREKLAFRKQLKYRKLGAKGCVWLSKGTGGMDPYPGLVKMAELLFCYNEDGKRIRRLIVMFSRLPKNFWWFKKFPNEIYYKLIKEFAESVKYADSYK